MPNRSSKKKRPEDVNALASKIVEEAMQEENAEESEEATSEDESTDRAKNPHAQALGRLGGLKGGKARAAKLTAQRRKEIARLAAKARWKKGD
jgi:hypothetical protein